MRHYALNPHPASNRYAVASILHAVGVARAPFKRSMRIHGWLSRLIFGCAGHFASPQILHYNKTQEFQEHHDYFDPAIDPPANFEKVTFAPALLLNRL
jgi:hypothetical protein